MKPGRGLELFCMHQIFTPEPKERSEKTEQKMFKTVPALSLKEAEVRVNHKEAYNETCTT